VHDLFDIVGLSRSAPPVEVRRVLARAVRRAHPDFQRSQMPAPAVTTPALPAAVSARRDVAVDFVDMSAVLDRMQASFFHESN
jgi:hypothetical protein